MDRQVRFPGCRQDFVLLVRLDSIHACKSYVQLRIIGFFGFVAIMARADRFAHLIEKLGFRR
jgi:hypothetical protein